MLKNIVKNSDFLYTICFLILFLIGLFVRLYNYPERITLGADSSRDAFVAIAGASQLQFPLTGPFISIAPVTTGPWYWIQLIITRLILPISLSPWIYIALVSILIMPILYRIGILLESRLFGLILVLVSVFSPQQIATSYELSNPSIIGTFTSFSLWLFLEILIKKKKDIWGLLFGLILGITVTVHYQAIALLLLILFFIFEKKYKILLYIFLGLAIIFVPMLIFELNNHWYNTRNMLQYIRFDQYRFWTPMSWTIFIRDFWPSYWIFVTGGTKLLGFILISFSGILYFYKVLIGKSRKYYLYLGLVYLVFIVIIRYYRGERFFGYLQFFHPFIFLMTGLVLYLFFRINRLFILGVIILILYISNVLPQVKDVMRSPQLTTNTLNIYNSIVSGWGDKQYSYYDCKDTDINLSRATGLVMVLNGKLKQKSENKILFYYGDCKLPNLLVDGKIINPEEERDPQVFFPKLGLLYNVSQATEGAILEKGGRVFSTEREYQSAARWWFAEQP